MRRAFCIFALLVAGTTVRSESYPEAAFFHNGRGGGLVDVTKPPFNARGDGMADDTAALSAAMRFVLERQSPACGTNGTVGCNAVRRGAWSVWLPNGTYRVTRTVCAGWPARAIDIRRGWDRVNWRYVRSEAEERELASLPGFRPVLHGDPSIAVLEDGRGDPLRGQYSNAPVYGEANENLRIEGESREGTVIRLDDRAEGFSGTDTVPVVSFAMLRRGSNTNQGNFIRDLTIDAGRRNPSAAALLWSGSNFGGIRNVTLRSSGGRAGIGLDLSVNNVCGHVRDLRIEGFDTAVRMCAGRESVLTVENALVRACGTGWRVGGNASGAGGDMLMLLGCRYEDVGEKVVRLRAAAVREVEAPAPFPRLPLPSGREDVAVVEDFGAVGDGIADDTAAVSRAFASGRSHVLFTRPNYRLDGTVTVPPAVTCVDGLHANIVRTQARAAAVFRDGGAVGRPVTFRRMYFAGGVLFDHVTTRPVVFEDVYVEFHHVRGLCCQDDFHLPRGCDSASGLWYGYRNATPALRKRVFAADCIQLFPGGEASRGEALENVDLEARMLNSEHFPGPVFSLRRSAARIYGFKSEDAPVLFALSESTLTATGGTFLQFQNQPGPLVDSVDSRFDVDFYFWHWQFAPDCLVRSRTAGADRVVSRSEYERDAARWREIARENACACRFTRRDK